MFARRAAIAGVIVVTAVLVFSSIGVLGGSAVVSSATAAPPRGPIAATPSSAAPAPSARAGPSSAVLTTTTHVPLTRPGTPLSATPNAAANTPLGSDILHTLQTKGVPLHDTFLPDLSYAGGPARSPYNGHINLTYTSSPAPYGIGDFGLKNVSGTITPYSLSTSSVEANFSADDLYGYSGDVSGPDEWGVQLNSVLNDVSVLGNTSNQFWTQNVFEYSPSLENLTFVSNVWNFSNPNLVLNCSSLYAVGGTFSQAQCVPGVYFYAVSAPVEAEFPMHIQVYLNSTLLSGRDAVYFNYSVNSALGTFSGNYCYVIFNSLAPGAKASSTPRPMYVAEGSTYNPAGLPDDFEVTLGGPGAGSNFDVWETSATYMTLQYWNSSAGAYLSVPSAYNVGGETGETSVGVNAAWARFGSGSFPSACVACVELSNGASFQYGMWGVGGATPAGNIVPEAAWGTQSYPSLVLDEPNAFIFVAEGSPFTTWTGTNWSLYQWEPDFATSIFYNSLPLGNYSYVVVLANFDAYEGTFSLPTDTSYPALRVNLGPIDTTMGVYTPLWAFNETGVDDLTSGYDIYGDNILFNDQYAPIGQVPYLSTMWAMGDAAYFPWFGDFNDFGYPVFPGMLIDDWGDFDVDAAPSFAVQAPPGPTYQFEIQHFGWPEDNNLQMVFYDDAYMTLQSSTITGWFPAVSYFGLSQSFASVVFWNTTDSSVYYNTFEAGGMGLFLYGGTDNYIGSNTFVTGTSPASANPGATVAEYWGSIGLVDSDWGDAYLYGSGGSYYCSECDTIWNNAFDTLITASSLGVDPYTGLVPTLAPGAFSSAWNIGYTPGETNIIGGDYLGGNYWWDYGFPDNPYGSLPDVELNYLPAHEGFSSGIGATICETDFGLCSAGAGDFYPLVNVPLYNVTFKERGLPSGTAWDVELYDYDLPYTDYQLEFEYVYGYELFGVENYTSAPNLLNFTEEAGVPLWYSPYAFTSAYVAVPDSGTVTLTHTNVTIFIQFVRAYHMTIDETGLPSGTLWSGGFCELVVDYCPTNSSHGSEVNISALPPGTYTWNAEANGFLTHPENAQVVVAANGTVHVTFVPAYRLSVHAVGLPGDVHWTFAAANGTDFNYTGDTAQPWLNLTVGSGTYFWQSTSPGYAATPSSGSLSVTGETNLTITFTAAASATGTLSGTVTPTTASVWIDGLAQTVGAGGTFSETLPIGVHSIEAKATGYATYFNNVTVSLGQTTTVTISLTPVTTTTTGSGSSSSSPGGVPIWAWALIGLLGALAAVFLVTTVLARRGKSPPTMQPYNAPPPAASAGASPPAGAGSPPWQESSPPESPPPAGGGSS
jgi:thermopsin